MLRVIYLQQLSVCVFFSYPFGFMQFKRGFEVSILLMGAADTANKVIRMMEFILLIQMLLK